MEPVGHRMPLTALDNCDARRKLCMRTVCAPLAHECCNELKTHRRERAVSAAHRSRQSGGQQCRHLRRHNGRPRCRRGGCWSGRGQWRRLQCWRGCWCGQVDAADGKPSKLRSRQNAEHVGHDRRALYMAAVDVDAQNHIAYRVYRDRQRRSVHAELLCECSRDCADVGVAEAVRIVVREITHGSGAHILIASQGLRQKVCSTSGVAPHTSCIRSDGSRAKTRSSAAR